MLIGEYRHSIDDKNRTSLPAKFKKVMGDVLYMTRGLDGVIDVYTKESWEALQNKLSELPMTIESNREFKRFILGASSEIVPDKQGRILISQVLKEYAGISDNDKKVVWIGVGDKAEIWSEKAWEERNKKNIKDISKIVSDLGGII